MRQALWRVVGVLAAASADEAGEITKALQASLADWHVRVYSSGHHLVVVVSVPASDGPKARALFEHGLAANLPATTVVADLWHGPRPVRALPTPRAA